MPTISEEIMDPNILKEEGNQHFKQGNFDDALSCYTKALEIADLKDVDKAVILKNRSACHLKQQHYQSAADDASASLEIVPNDPKSLYRRCQAYEQLGSVEEAYKDAAALLKVDPKNAAIQPILKRLNPIIQDKVKEQNSTASKVSQMFNLAFDPNGEKDEKLKAVNNLVVLAREEAGAKFIVEQSGIERLMGLLDTKDAEIVQAGIRVLACLSNKSKARCLMIDSQIGVPKICLLIGSQNEAVSTSGAHLLQNLITYITEIHLYQEEVKAYNEKRKQGDPCRYPKFEQDDDQKKFVNETFHLLIKMLQNSKVSAYGRDSAMELLMKNVTRKDGVHWTKNFLDTDGLEGLLTVAGAVKQHKTLSVTDQSKQHASVALSRVYDDLLSDKERDKFREKCQDFFKDLFSDEIFESKVEAVKAISTLLQGPYDVGSVMLSFEGVSEIMFALAKSDVAYHQQVAVEAIVHSASKKDKCAGLLGNAVPILKKLFKEADDAIKVRALVGLCKLGSYGGCDASTKPMAEGSTLTLAKACRKFLTNPSKDIDMRRWATEGLAFLTLDADVKEELINDTEALKSLIDVAAKAEKNILYPAATVFVNLTNSYDKPDIMPEMIELAKFSKQHIPEQHEKDKADAVKERVHKLAQNNVVSAMVTLSKTDSPNSREQLSRVYLALATEEDLRGLIIQQGGGKSLLQLALDKNTDAGMIHAAQALAKLTITMNPQTAFPGQRVYETVRPLLSLLHIDRTALQNFEALLALTNLGSISDSLRKRIISEKGVSRIEHYMFEEHEMLRRASTECLCNMIMNEEYRKRFLEENDLVKLWTLFCGESDDPLLVRAASGGLAMLTQDPEICKKVLNVKPWYEILLSLAVNESTEIQYRGCYIISNMIDAGKDVAEKVIEGQMLEVLMAVSILQEPEREKAKKCVTEALEKALEYGLIEPSQTAPKPS